MENFLERTADFFQQCLYCPLFEFQHVVFTPFNFIRFTIIILVTFGLSTFFKNFYRSFVLKHKDYQPAKMYRINWIIHYLVLIIGFTFATASLGIDLTQLAIIAGALGVGIGFGLQNIFNNFFSGIILLFESQLKMGDYIELETGQIGEIEEIYFRYTTLKTPDGAIILVPNSSLVSALVTNWSTKTPYRRLHIPFSLTHDCDHELLSKTISQNASAISHTINDKGYAKPEVLIKKMEKNNNLQCELVVWVNEKDHQNSDATCSSYLASIKDSIGSHVNPEAQIRFASKLN